MCSTPFWKACDIMGLETGWVYLRDPERETVPSGQLVWVSPRSRKRRCCRTERRLLQLPARSAYGRLVHPRHAPRLRPSCLAADGYADQAPFTIPIAARGQQYGVLNLLCSPAEPSTAADLEMLSTSARKSPKSWPTPGCASSWRKRKQARQAAAGIPGRGAGRGAQPPGPRTARRGRADADHPARADQNAGKGVPRHHALQGLAVCCWPSSPKPLNRCATSPISCARRRWRSLACLWRWASWSRR